MPEKALKNVASKYHLSVDQAKQILELLDGGYSIPYIMRYHKELAAGLEPEGFYELIDEKRRLEKLESRRQKILSKLRERDILEEELEQRIHSARNMRELIDYYVPYRPRKRSRSRQALSQGLRPLAGRVLAQEEFIPDMGAAAEPYVDPGVDLPDVDAVLEGAFHIISDWVAEEKEHRDHQREVFGQEAELVTRRVGRSLPGRLVREFRHYFSFREKVSEVHPYHMLCILRGKRENALEYELQPPLAEMIRAAADLYLAGGGGQLDQLQAEVRVILKDDRRSALKQLNGTEFLLACIEHSLRNVLADVVVREFDKDLCQEAENLALQVIRRNLKAMLMTRPMARPVLGIHPGYRTGCNVAAVAADGEVLETATVYPHAPLKQVEEAKATLVRLLQEHEVEVVAIGQGTAAEETEETISGLIDEQFGDLRYTLVSEVGLESYVSSRAAKGELPEIEPEERWAVAVARRVLDPLSELVKVSPREIALEPYVDDVHGGALKRVLDRTIEECVCATGVEANTDHYSLLRYVSGLGPEKALELVEYRQKRPLRNRREMRQVPKIDTDSYERACGFVKVRGSTNPLDVTRIHPRFYPVALQICKQLDLPPEELATEEGRRQMRQRGSEVQLSELEKEFDVHYLLLKDIVAELGDPWPDPRRHGRQRELRQRRLSVEDLTPGTWFTATVKNVVDFGVFADIGVGEDGLIHISELSEGYVETPYDVVSVGDKVRVRVVRVEPERQRIALSMREEGPEEEEARAPRPRKERPRRRRQPSRPRRTAEVPAEKPAVVQQPKSTVGEESRRVKRARLDRQETGAPEKERPRDKAREAAPAAEKRDEANEEAPEGMGDLLQKLDFASIEKRGEARE